MRLSVLLLTLLLALLPPLSFTDHTALAQDFDQYQVVTSPISDRVYLMTGAGGNMGLYVGTAGVLLVDADYTAMSDKVKAAIAEITAQPVQYLVNTHWHFDHAGGNENFAAWGSLLVAHENVRHLLAADQHLAIIDRDVPASPAEAWPIITFTDSVTFHLDDEVITVFHVPHAHTDGDGIVHFRRANIVHTGDLYFNCGYPFIDVANGGHIDGIIAGVEIILGICDHETKIIPGHGPLATKADLEIYHSLLRDFRAAIAAEFVAGKDLHAILAAKPTVALDEKWGDTMFPPHMFTEMVYLSLTYGGDRSGLGTIAASREGAGTGGGEGADTMVAESFAYVQQIHAWHQERLESLRSETGWLTLVGLHPLQEGAQTVGSAADSDVQLVDKAPARLGILTLTGEDVVLEVAEGVDLQVARRENADEAAQSAGTDRDTQAARTATIALQTDAQGEPTVLELGSLSCYVIRRGDRKYLRVKDRESEVRRKFQGIERFPVDPRWRVTARLEIHDPPRTVSVPNVLGQASESPSPGTLVFELAGRTCQLIPIGEPGASLFVVFGDDTNRESTYGGGRFLSVPSPGPDRTVILDFNKATNPPCVFTPYATCPLPPAENVLPVAVEAGEKMWGEQL